MSTSDWPQMDTSAVEISPGTEASSDLFGGDLFGDELLDMYHSAVVGNGGTDAVDPISNDMNPPALPNLVMKMKPENDAADHGSPNPIISGDYEGLNAFRPSTSMSDFTNLLENTSASAIPAPASVMPPVIPSDPIMQAAKKRSNDQCSAVADPSMPMPILVGQPGAGKRPKDDQYNSNAVLKVKEEDLSQSPLISNRAPAMAMQSSGIKTDPFGMSMISPQGVMGNVSLGPPTIIGTSNKVGPMQIPTTQAIPAPPSNLVCKPMNVNSHQLLPVAQHAQAKDNKIHQPPPSHQIKTEESFKVVAQAAVTNLILSAGNNNPRLDSNHHVTDSDSDSSQHLKPVNTTSAHVAALTSNNWVAACAASINNAPPGTVAAAQAAALAAASDPAAAKAARARRATLTADERARQNRDRNREHARNTRLRKKAYVEELKRTLTELVSQRDAQDLERRHEKQRDLEVREVRYRVMEEFLKLRARGSDANLLARWVAILEDGFTLALPKTDYRTMVESQMKRQVSADAASANNDAQLGQVLRGATECLEDASKVAQFINDLNTPQSNTAVTMTYLCDRKHFIMDGVSAVLDWTVTTTGATTQGVKSELTVKGCMRATFSPASNKLICAELLFDTGSVSSYLNRFSQCQTVNNPTTQGNNSYDNTCTVDTDALLDSVLPPVTSEVNGMSSNVALISYEKGDSSDEDYSAQASN